MLSLEHAIVYDIETICNCYTLHFEALNSDLAGTFEISEYRDDRREMLAWFAYWQAQKAPMIGFNNLGFDYSVIHFIYNNPDASVWEIYDKAQDTIHDQTMFKMVWESDRFAPQVDLYKIWHFDNPNKRTSLKALQFAMRSETVLEMPLPFDKPIAPWDVQPVLIPYNIHDVKETKRFALFSLDAIKFRIELTDMLKGDVLNWNDTKIGAQIVEQRLGDDICYTYESGRREKRQTRRETVALNDIIFPFIRFTHPEFNRVLTWLRGQVLREDELTGRLKTKGVFQNVSAVVNGFSFDIGTGGIHGSVSAQRFVADSEWAIVDIDVAGMYPANMIANRLYPEHLGERFVFEFSQLPKERAQYAKGTTRNRAFKLAGNGTFGNTNNIHSIFLDAAVTMATTVNGQLVIMMLAEWLLSVPTVSIIQANTDGITYRIHRSQMAAAVEVRKAWEAYTRLVLEEVEYSRMWIRDVNSYCAESTKGKLKMKGAYWYPVNFPDDITNENAWHKDFSAQICIMAAVEHMTRGVAIERFIYDHGDPFDFMCRAKVDRSSQLWIGDQQVQRIQRYYVARAGGAMRKVSPPAGPMGEFKRRSGISDWDYESVRRTLAPGTHDQRIHTKNRSRYETREMGIESGFAVADCNRAADFSWNNVNYDWYVQQAQKLVVM